MSLPGRHLILNIVFRTAFAGFPILATGLAAGCSVRTLAANMIADALTEGSGAFLSDEDPQLVKEAIPFGLKTYEGLLEKNPEHEGLLLSAASGFASYAYLLQIEAEKIDRDDYQKAREIRKRASRHYLRARGYAFRGLNLKDKKFVEKLMQDPPMALKSAGVKEVPFLYWAGASWAGAAAADKGNTDLIAGIPVAGALVKRAVALDESFEAGSAYEFLISFEASRPGGDLALAREYYQKALFFSQGKRASVHLALAEGVCVAEQDLAEFKKLLRLALEIDIDQYPEIRLLNTIAQDRARWLKTKIPDLFLEAG